MKCLKKIAIFSLVFFVSLFFIMPVQAKSTQTYSIIYDLQDANWNKIAQVKYKNKDFTSEIGIWGFWFSEWTKSKSRSR